MFYKFYNYLKQLSIKMNVLIVKLICSGSDISIGKNAECFGVPSLKITDGATITIGDNVVIKKGVEIRAHKSAKIKIGNNCKIDDGVRIIATNGSTVHIGNGSKIGFHSVLNGGGGIEIGNLTSLYGFVYIQSSSHNFKGDAPIKKQGFSHGRVKIGSNVLLGANVVVLPSVTIEDNCLIGANAVVTKSVKENSISLGLPAQHHSSLK